MAFFIFLGVNFYGPFMEFLKDWGNNKPGDVTVAQVAPGDEASSGEEEKPEPPPINREELKAVYMPQDIAADKEKLRDFILNIDKSGFNSVLVDIKTNKGAVLFATDNKNALEWGAVADSIIDIDYLAGTLKENGLGLAVRIYTYEDEIAARGERDIAIKYQGSEMLWLDNFADSGGKPWLDPYSQGANGYILELALEAVSRGADSVILAGMHFPATSGENATFAPGSDETARNGQLIKNFEAFKSSLNEQNASCFAEIPLAHAYSFSMPVQYGADPLGMFGDSVFVNAGSGIQALRKDYGEAVPDPGESLGDTCINVIEHIKTKYSVKASVFITAGESRQELLASLKAGNCGSYIIG